MCEYDWAKKKIHHKYRQDADRFPTEALRRQQLQIGLKQQYNIKPIFAVRTQTY